LPAGLLQATLRPHNRLSGTRTVHLQFPDILAQV